MDNSTLYPFGRPIVLVGMMGVGKTSVGEKLAGRLGLPFFDSDAEIDKHVGMPHSEFHRTQGESAFRQVESEAIVALLQQNEPFVLAAAGGAFESENTRNVILTKSFSIWLRLGIDENFRRAADRNGRLLMQHPDREQRFRALYSKRALHFAMADVTVENAGTLDQTVDTIISVQQKVSPCPT